MIPKVEAPKIETTKPIEKSTSQVKSYVDDHKQKSDEDEGKANSQLMIFGLGGVVLNYYCRLGLLFCF